MSGCSIKQERYNLMKRNQRVIIISICIIVIFGFLRWLNHPLPQYVGSKTIPELIDSVDVFTDNYGVPHVFAQNEDDLFFIAGYIAATERLFQLTTVALAVRGELSYTFGDDFISSDIYLRTWRIHDTATKIVNAMKPENKRIFDTFCAGINKRIDEVKHDPPIEFKVLGIDPPYWDPTIVAGYARMMAHEMQGSWKSEIVFGAVASYFKKEKLIELIPGDESSMQTISQSSMKNLKPVFDKILANEFDVRSILGDPSADIGSNNWVVSGELTESGKPILANDPHLAFTQPPRWFEIHIKGGRFNTSGVCIAGIPIPVIGQNENVAWGFTNSMVDDVDFFIETLDPNDSTQYLWGNEWRKIKFIEEKISRKNGTDTTITIRMTHHGPIISDIHPLLKKSDVAMSMSWTGHWVTTEMDAWIKLNTMENWDDFTKGVELFGVPGQNIVYADIEGNIGWRPAVFIPIRKQGSSLVPRPGDDPSYDWKGKVPYNEMPFLYNPPKQYISTANNKTIDDSFPYYISGLWADPSRAEQIVRRLDTLENINVHDMKSIQLDVTSPFSEFVVPYFIEVERKDDEGNIKRAFQFLKEWDFVEDVDSEAALIFHSVLRNLTLNIYGDEFALLGDNYLEAYTGLKYLVHRRLRDILASGNSSWIDNINTRDRKESLNEIIRLSIKDAIGELEDSYGDNISNWKWGDAHSVTHKHMLSKIKIINWLFNLEVGPFRSGGSDKTPNAGGYSFNRPYKQTSGASMRRIVDFNNMNETQFIIPTGQSGIPSSPHYKDQAEMYRKGLYRTTYFDEDYIRNSDQFRHMKFLP